MGGFTASCASSGSMKWKWGSPLVLFSRTAPRPAIQMPAFRITHGDTRKTLGKARGERDALRSFMKVDAARDLARSAVGVNIDMVVGDQKEEFYRTFLTNEGSPAFAEQFHP